jgi:hypothetical protein
MTSLLLLLLLGVIRLWIRYQGLLQNIATLRLLLGW